MPTIQPGELAAPAGGRCDIAAVVVGRNEGERLGRVLRSALAAAETVVYVDSGSSDGSVERARGLGVHVVELRVGPFTAARGRDAGLEEVRRLRPDVGCVQFIDGDCILDAGWMEFALAHLERNPRTGAVCGEVREEYAATNFFSRLADVDWNAPPGRIEYTGGNALMRVRAVDEAGGWPTDLIAGEEPDLCFRMRDRGWVIERLEAPMVLHDIGMRRFGAYWRRCVRTGHAYAEVGWRRRRGAGRPWFRKAVSNVAYGLVLPAGIVVAAAAYWPAAVFLGALYARVVVSAARSCRRRGETWPFSVVYGLLNVACKPAGALGALRFGFDRVTGAGPRIIEYKPVPFEPRGRERLPLATHAAAGDTQPS